MADKDYDTTWKACQTCLSSIGGEQTCEGGMPGICDLCGQDTTQSMSPNNFVNTLRLSYVRHLFLRYVDLQTSAARAISVLLEHLK